MFNTRRKRILVLSSPIVASFVVQAAMNVREQRQVTAESTLKLALLQLIPTRYISYSWGKFTSLKLPRPLRKPVLGLYTKVFGCDLDDLVNKNLEEYESLQDYFTRKIDMSKRAIDEEANLISPSDGVIISQGIVENNTIEQIKGIKFNMSKFMNEDIITSNPNQLFHYCIIYLGPGDYHRFHSPTEWNLFRVRHIQGDLLSVNPIALRKIKGLFSLNERINLIGKWRYGYFNMIPVAATNVGNIQLHLDTDIKTNKGIVLGSKKITEALNVDCELKRGQEIGLFKLGSTIVLLFEGPREFKFLKQIGDKVKVGEALGNKS
ncbi:Phosphatidylserine decarboxylase-related domain-containing protein [Rozella allomycis CSF55]|uniref:phosphatidylserine decarboxylase n=1 Tax=Rozella allomycis (strain CSF55) TaxID=988480 RepID=A0A075B3A8_ROZAC|nr:Phosphatidylserine decarboxylase-related domain-containing protein [Rozella allomycis CSF55]|eukprot:EPZ35293.1 Phosphatidylserine decarboxylase-related domain-containing protein [Rozella allomycis CSF55]